MPAVRAQIGRVSIVNVQENFVLIDTTASRALPRPGTILTTSSDSGDTGSVKVAPERKRSFISADIIKGTPAPGDEVYR